MELQFWTGFFHRMSHDKLLSTRVLRHVHGAVWFLLLRCNCLSSLSLHPGHQESNDVRVNGCHKYSSITSTIALWCTSGASMTARCHVMCLITVTVTLVWTEQSALWGKSKEAFLSLWPTDVPEFSSISLRPCVLLLHCSTFFFFFAYTTKNINSCDTLTVPSAIRWRWSEEPAELIHSKLFLVEAVRDALFHWIHPSHLCHHGFQECCRNTN
jgi:hypothetical protein